MMYQFLIEVMKVLRDGRLKGFKIGYQFLIEVMKAYIENYGDCVLLYQFLIEVMKEQHFVCV